MYSKNSLFLEKLPTSLVDVLNSKNKIEPGRKVFQFKYYRYHLGCELSYFMVKNPSWSSKVPKDKKMPIYGFVDEFFNMNEEVLYLEGLPHHIGLTPHFWSSLEALERSAAVWTNGVVYNKQISQLGLVVRKSIIAQASGRL